MQTKQKWWMTQTIKQITVLEEWSSKMEWAISVHVQSIKIYLNQFEKHWKIWIIQWEHVSTGLGLCICREIVSLHKKSLSQTLLKVAPTIWTWQPLWEGLTLDNWQVVSERIYYLLFWEGRRKLCDVLNEFGVLGTFPCACLLTHVCEGTDY